MFFREILELYDWIETDKTCPNDTENENFRQFRFYPRFVRSLSDDGKEILSLCKVLEYLLEQDKPLVDEKDLDHLLRCSHKEWLDYTDKVGYATESSNYQLFYCQQSFTDILTSSY